MGISTETFAEQLGGLKPESIRHRLCMTGSYFGVQPEKLPNGRLLWPDDAKEQVLAAARDRKAAA